MGLCKKWMMGRWLTMAALPRIRVIQRHPSLHRSACTEGGSAKWGTRRPRNSSASGGKPTTVVARTRRGSEAARRAHRRRGQLSSQSTRRSSWLLRRAREWLPMYGCHWALLHSKMRAYMRGYYWLMWWTMWRVDLVYWKGKCRKGRMPLQKPISSSLFIPILIFKLYKWQYK
jgi:hypothetical protein